MKWRQLAPREKQKDSEDQYINLSHKDTEVPAH